MWTVRLKVAFNYIFVRQSVAYGLIMFVVKIIINEVFTSFFLILYIEIKKL